MTVALTVLGGVLAAILGWAGIAKLREPDSLSLAMRQLRVPDILAGPVIQRSLPWVEIGLAVGLVLLGGGWAILVWAACLAMSGAYLVVIQEAVRRAEAVSCNCFGAASAVVDRWTLTRNILLVVASGVGLVGAISVPGSLVGRMLSFTALQWGALAVGVLVVALVAVLIRDQADPGRAGTNALRLADRRTENPPAPAPGTAQDMADDYVRAPIPPSVYRPRQGVLAQLRDLVLERATLLIYVSATCASCAEVLAQLDDYQQRLPDLQVVAMVRSRPEIERLPAGVRDRVVVDASDSVLDGLHIRHVPSAVLLGMDRLLAGGPVAGVEQIDQMVSEIEQEFRAAADAASEANA